MADINDFLIDRHRTPKRASQSTVIGFEFTLSAGNQNDVVNLFALPTKHWVSNCWLYVSGTLGASCTLTLRIASGAITGATTAGSESMQHYSRPQLPAAGPKDVNLLIGGANVGTAAVVGVMVQFEPIPKLFG